MVGALQIKNSKKAAVHDLLARTQHQDGYHPQLRHSFGLTPYPSSDDILEAVFAYAGVPNLVAFRNKFCPEFGRQPLLC